MITIRRRPNKLAAGSWNNWQHELLCRLLLFFCSSPTSPRSFRGTKVTILIRLATRMYSAGVANKSSLHDHEI